MDSRNGTPEKFWKKVQRTETCWLWLGDKDRRGYGRVRRREFSARTVQAHRYAWFLTHGDWPDLLVCHRCDIPNCVNPEHLFLGTHQDNMDDMWRKGRGKPGHIWGAKQGQAKLTDEKVLRIRALAEQGQTHDDIAAQFGVCRSNVSIIVRRKGWTHV